MNWTGPYVGANGGLGAPRFQVFPFQLAGVGAGVLVPGDLPLNFDRGLFGLQAGYNWQFWRYWIVGLEADFDGSDIQDVRNFATVPLGQNTLAAGINLNRFGTVRPRLGFTVTPSAFVYLTVGWFYGSTSSSVTFAGSVGSFNHDISGWARGFGMEYALTDLLSFKTEYIYLDGGHDTLSTPAFSVGRKMIAHTLKAGLNFKLGPWLP